jgi:hypothetical protein
MEKIMFTVTSHYTAKLPENTAYTKERGVNIPE